MLKEPAEGGGEVLSSAAYGSPSYLHLVESPSVSLHAFSVAPEGCGKDLPTTFCYTVAITEVVASIVDPVESLLRRNDDGERLNRHIPAN
jgi:hypothetical protein